MEVEPGTTETNRLGSDYRYTGVPAGQSRLCSRHVDGRFGGYDSPELATLVSNTARKAT